MSIHQGKVDRVLATAFDNKYLKAVMSTDENADFGYMSCSGPYPVFYFGGTEQGIELHVSGYYGRDSYDENTLSTTVTASTRAQWDYEVGSYIQSCGAYFVDKGKLSQAKYTDLIVGAHNWWLAKNPDFYYGRWEPGGRLDTGSVDSGVFATFGDYAVYKQAEANPDNIVSINVESEWVEAYYYAASDGSPFAFLAFDTIQKAIEDEYITDPEIIDFFNSTKWEVIEESRCNWTVNIDGVKNPDVTIMWAAPMIEGDDVEAGTATVTIEAKVWQTQTLIPAFMTQGIYAYSKHSYQFSWSNMATYCQIPGITKILSNVFDGFEATIELRMWVTYFLPGGMEMTSPAVVRIGYNGSGDGYIEEPTDGSTITFTHTSTDEALEEFLDDLADMQNLDDPTVTDPTLDQAFSGVSLLTKTYVITKSRLQQLGRFLWSRDFFDYIQDLNASPIENIVSVKMVPFNIPHGEDTEIVLGNVASGILGGPVDIDYNCKHTIGEVTILKKYPANCNFLNSHAFTKLSIFLPFIGFKELDPDVFLNHTMKVEYINDIITGNCKAVIYADDVPICDFSGQIGLDVPISSTNRAQVEAGLIAGVGQTMGSLVSGDLSGAFSGAMSLASNSFHTETRGTNSPACDSFMTHDCFYILENAEVQYPSKYNHIHGRPLNLTKTLRNVSGFTVCENVDTSGIQSATLEEKQYIKEMLEKGVYL